MYLHQQIVDLLLLQTDKKLTTKLHSKFTYSITCNVNNNNIYKAWNNNKTNSNVITKLRYQYVYIRNQYKYFILAVWDYIKGLLDCNTYIVENAAYNGFFDLFIICINNGIIPDIKILNECANGYYTLNHTFNDRYEIFKIIIGFGVVPTKTTLSYASRYGHTKIFEHCLNYNLIPDIDMMHNAVVCGNIKIYKICLCYGIIPTKYILRKAIEYKNIEVVKSCMSYGLNVDDIDYQIAIANFYIEFKSILEKLE